MCKKMFAFLCCALLFVTSSSKSQQISNNKKKYHNLTIQNKIDTDSTTFYSDEITLRYDLYKKVTNNARYGMQNEFRINSTKNDREDVDSILYKLSRRSVHNHEDDDQIPIISHTNVTNVNHGKNFTSQEDYENLLKKNNSMSNEVFENSSKDSNESNIVPYEMCHNITCILLCCPLGDRMRLNDSKCISEEIEYVFPNVYEYTNDSMQNENKRVDELFQLVVYDSCQERERVLVDKDHQYDYKIFANGSIYLSYYKTFVKSTSYCFAVYLERGDKLEVTFCSETLDEVIKNAIMFTPEIRSSSQALNIYACFRTVCILFLAPIFLVYSILPELRNIHGFMLCNYCAVTSFAYIVYVVNVIHYHEDSSYFVCITLAFFEYFSFMSSYFWLSAMSFNIWRTSRGFCSLQKNVKQPEKRKLVYYVAFAYGCPFILAVVCVIIVDFISDYLPAILRPEFWLGNCWYYGENLEMYTLYYQGLQSACIIISICLSISAALKIKQYEKDIGLRLTDSENKRYNDNKKWFNLYLKLFIVKFTVMGIHWSVLTTIWLLQNANYVLKYYLFVFINLIEIVQNLCTFIIFVCNKKIKMMLLKRFGCETNATSNCTATSEISTQGKANSCEQEKCHVKDSSDETDL